MRAADKSGDTRETSVPSLPFSDKPFASRAFLASSEALPLRQASLSPQMTPATAAIRKTPSRVLNTKRAMNDPMLERETPVAKRLKTRMEIGETLDALREREERFVTPESELYE
jgi:hypothetical protein